MNKINKKAPLSCYCGENKDTSQTFLECVVCKRLCHERCVSCLDSPMLIGDKFYIFICSVCNTKSEYLGRIQMEWNEITQLLIYNLSVFEKRKYFHIHSEIIPFLYDSWKKFHLNEDSAKSKEIARKKVLQALETDNNTFKCAKEIKKCKDFWSLRIKSPPEPPNVVPKAPSAKHLKKDKIVWEFKVEGREYHTLNKKSKKILKSGKENSTNIAKKYTPSTQHTEKMPEIRQNTSRKKTAININNHKSQRKRSSSLFNKDAAHSRLLNSVIPLQPENSNISFKQTCKKSHSKCSKSNRLGLLDYLIPDNGENPFLTEKEKLLKRNNDNERSIIGKRTTSSGKIEYLIERDM